MPNLGGMNATTRPVTGALLLGALALLAAGTGTALGEETIMRHARGTFDVTVTPLALDGPADDPSLGRFALAKEFHGDLRGQGRGQMLTSGSGAGSGAYVAIETVTAKLDGRNGTFALQHRGTMEGGRPNLEVTIVPASGTGGLAGIAGTLNIAIEGRIHRYDLEYSLPPAD
jgi:hypothetical protein